MGEAREFAQRLKTALERAGAPPFNAGQTEWLADKIGVTKSAASRWISGAALPHRKKIQNIAKALGVDWVWLETGEKPAANVDKELLHAAVKGAALAHEARGIGIKNAAGFADIVVRVYIACMSEQLSPDQAETIAKVMAMTI